MDPNSSAGDLETSVANSAPAAGPVTKGCEVVNDKGIHKMHTVFSGAVNTPFCLWACLG